MAYVIVLCLGVWFNESGVCHGRVRIVVVFTATCAITGVLDATLCD